MPTITSLSPQKKRKERFNVEVDGEFLIGVSSETVAKFSLSRGKKVTKEELEQIVKDSEFGLILDKALRFLGIRPRSVWEIEEYLKKKRISGKIQEMVITKLLEKKYLDDVTFATWWIEQRMQFLPKVKRPLILELLQKRVNKRDIEDAFEKLQDFDEEKLCLQVAEKKKRQFSSFPIEKQKEKLYALLVRRGFSFGIVRDVVDNVLRIA